MIPSRVHKDEFASAPNTIQNCVGLCSMVNSNVSSQNWQRGQSSHDAGVLAASNPLA